jgi:uncharacterized RDD family membrane protein YckC
VTGPGGAPQRRPWHDATPPAALARGRRAALRGEPAGVVTRTSANVLDLLVVVLAVAAGYLAVAALRFVLSPTSFAWPAVGGGTLLVLTLCVQAVYFAVTWSVLGGTWGDRVLALSVRDERGRRLRWGRSAIRAVACTVFPIGLAWVLVSRENRSVQDLLVGTAVVYD